MSEVEHFFASDNNTSNNRDPCDEGNLHPAGIYLTLPGLSPQSFSERGSTSSFDKAVYNYAENGSSPRDFQLFVGYSGDSGDKTMTIDPKRPAAGKLSKILWDLLVSNGSFTPIENTQGVRLNSNSQLVVEEPVSNHHKNIMEVVEEEKEEKEQNQEEDEEKNYESSSALQTLGSAVGIENELKTNVIQEKGKIVAMVTISKAVEDEFAQLVKNSLKNKRGKQKCKRNSPTDMRKNYPKVLVDKFCKYLLEYTKIDIGKECKDRGSWKMLNANLSKGIQNQIDGQILSRQFLAFIKSLGISTEKLKVEKDYLRMNYGIANQMFKTAGNLIAERLPENNSQFGIQVLKTWPELQIEVTYSS